MRLTGVSNSRFGRMLTQPERPTVADGVALFLIVLVFFWKVVTRLEVCLFIEDLQTNWAAQYYAASQMRRGIFPLWDMFTWGGAVPIFARSEFGYAHPMNLLFNLLSWTTLTLPGSAKWIIDYHIVFHHFLAAFFTYLFCRFGMHLGRVASLAAGLVWSFSGYFIAQVTHRMFPTGSVYLPLVLLLFDLYVEKKRVVYAVLSGLCFGVCLLGGYIQISGYIFGFVVLYVLWAFAIDRRVTLKNLIVFLFCFCLFSGGLSLIQLLPQLELIRLAERNEPFWGSYAFAIYGHLVPKDLITLLAPYRTLAAAHWNERTVYFGAVSLVIILLGLFRVERKRRLLFPGLFMIVCFLHMLGPGYGVSYYAYKFIPVIGSFHHQVRSAVLFDFCAAMLVGLALDALTGASLTTNGNAAATSAQIPGARRRRPRGHVVGIGLFAVLEVALILICLFGILSSRPAVQEMFKADLVQALLLLIAACAVALAGLVFVWLSRAAAVLFLALVVLDLFLFNSNSPWHRRPGNNWVTGYVVADHAKAFGQIKQEKPCRISGLSNNAWAIGLQTIHGYSDHNMIREYSQLYHTCAGRMNTLFYDLFNVKYILLQANPPAAVNIITSSYYVGHPGEHAIDRNPATEWIEAKGPLSWGDPDVTGDWMLLTFADPVTVAKIAIAPRAARPLTAIRRLKLEFQNGSAVDAVLRDEGDLQVASFAPQKTTTVKLTIVETGEVTSTDVGFREIYLYDKTGNELIANAKNSKYRQALEPGCYENLDVLPRAWLVGEFRVAEPKAIFDAILLKSFDPRRTVFLEKPPEGYLGSDPLKIENASAIVERYEPNHITVRCRTPEMAILVLSEVFYPGWQARIGERTTPIYRADYTLRAVVVPAGESVVEFHYSPLSFKIGLAGTLATLAAAVVVIVLTRRQRPKTFQGLTQDYSR